MRADDQPLLDLAGLPYAALEGIYDELVDASGVIRPSWQPLNRFLEGLTHQDIHRLQRETSRRLKEQGVYYHVYDDPEGIRRTWKLDPLPLLIPEAEWNGLEAGLIQRSHLMSLILEDLYGDQTCLSAGLLPPEVWHQHPAYLSMLRGAVNQPLTLYAADLARGPDGAWWALSDRAQGPSGTGYVLEARLVTRQTLGEFANGLTPAPLSQFYQHLKRHLTGLSRHSQREPTIVLLSPGVGNEAYFEHAYVAAQLGITLVEGGDLMVRRGKVYLKTVNDLKPVDVMLRRVDDLFCDPIHLRPDSMLGVPGLLQAQALGNIGMANPIGSSFLESPALLPFLQGLCRHFLNEDLKLPNVASWWCGDAKALDHVLKRLDEMVVKTLDRSDTVTFGGLLSHAQKERLVAQMRAQPWRFVGQQTLSFSTMPVLAQESMQPRHLVLRGYAAGNGRDYDVMPGGLTRVTPDANGFVVSSQRGGGSKDTWVLRSGVKAKDVLQLRPNEVRSAAAVLTSRAAENLFWMARYNERTESLLRLMRAYVRRLENPYDFGFESELEVLKALQPMLTTFCPMDPERLARMETVQTLVLNGQKVGSVSYNLNASIRSAYMLRDLWSGDCWRMIEEIEELLHFSEKNWALSSVERFTQPFLSALLAFWGAANESMARDQGGLWLMLGRRIERAINILGAVLNVIPELEHDKEAALREMLLESHDCLYSHRRGYGMNYAYYKVWQHLLLDRGNPRSLQYALIRIEPLLNRLNAQEGDALSALQKQFLAIQTAVTLADPAEWATAEKTQSELAPFLLDIQSKLFHLGLALENQYFKHAQPVSRLR